MNYKCIILPLILILMVTNLTLISADSGKSDLAYLIKMSTPNFLPTTINSGDIVSLSINIQNKGAILDISDLQATLNLGVQFEGVDINQNMGFIAPENTKTAIFQFKVKQDVVSGYYPATIDIRYLRKGEIVNEQKEITIPITNAQKKLDLSISPNVINPGNETEMTFSIKNLTGVPVSNVNLNWTEKTGLILPLGSDNKKYISLIGANSTETISTKIASDPNITSGIYSLDINIFYSGPSGILNQQSQIGIIVGGKTDFEAGAEVQSNNLLSLSIANIGSNNAGAVVAKIPKQDNITISGSNTAVLGNINKGDFTLANFQIKPTVGFATKSKVKTPDFNKSNTFLLNIEYTDTTGTRQKIEKILPLNVAPTITTDIQTRSNSSVMPIFLFVTLLIFGVAYNWRNKKSWKSFAGYMIIIAILFLMAIYLFNSNTTVTIVIALISIALLLWHQLKTKGK